MKTKIWITIGLTLLTVRVSVAQDYAKLANIEFRDSADYAKNEHLVLECSNFILDSPVGDIENDQNHTQAMQFIMRWMDGTPDYLFNLDETINNVSQSNPSLLGIYMAAMTKYVLENKDESKDQGQIEYNAFKMLIRYCEDPSNHVKQSDAIQELIKAKNENRLMEYLNIHSNQLRA